MPSPLLLLLAISLIVAATTDAPTPHPESNFCQPLQEGCASAAVCECFWLFTYCNMDDVPAGQCRLSKYGIVALTFFVLFVVALLVIVAGCCWCCCCRRCCKPGQTTAAHETHFHFPSIPHPHDTTSSLQQPYGGYYYGRAAQPTFTEYDKL